MPCIFQASGTSSSWHGKEQQCGTQVLLDLQMHVKQ